MTASSLVHGLSFDLEDWEQNVRRRVGLGAPRWPLGCEVQTARLLDFCDEMGARATFFVVGAIARDLPRLVRAVAQRGHEVACHSDNHALVSSLSRDEFFRDTRDAKSRLEDIMGRPVKGYRAPEFSVGSIDHWCFEVLAELGFTYDSSVFPVSGVRYGIAGAPHRPFAMRLRTGSLVELPLLSVRAWTWRLPAAGGTYYRLLPTRLLRRAIELAEAEHGVAVLYFHPYEFADSYLWLRGAGWRNALALRYLISHNFGTSLVMRRLRRVARSFRFGPLDAIADVTSTTGAMEAVA